MHMDTGSKHLGNFPDIQFRKKRLTVAIHAQFDMERAEDVNTVRPAPFAAGPHRLVLLDAGSRKIEAIKLIRDVRPGLGLKEAKDLSEAPGSEIVAGLAQTDADALARRFADIGARVEVR